MGCAALNKTIAQAKSNGYDPKTLYSVNTLRGYFSGDAQARSNAIHSISHTVLNAGGAYETSDFGVHAIAGAAPEGLDTSMPFQNRMGQKTGTAPACTT